MSQVESISEEQILSCFDQAMTQAFEAYFFIEAVRTAAVGMHFDESNLIEVELIFRGPFSGHLHLQVAKDTAIALVASLPLPNRDISEELIGDLFAELTNTVGGRIVAALAGNDFAFDLTIPTVKFGSASNKDERLARSYATDYGPVLVSVSHLKEHKENERRGA